MKQVYGWLILCLLGMCSEAGAGAWTQKAEGYYIKLAFNHLDSRGDLDGQGKRVPKALSGKLRDVNVSLYLEYGLSDRLTWVTSVPFKQLKDARRFATGIAREKRTGFGDLEARLRWLAVKKTSWVASIGMGGKIPLWLGQDDLTRVPLSSKHVDLDFRGLVGVSLYPVYATGELGYRGRGGVFSDEAFYALEMGVSLGRRLLVKGFVSGIRTYGFCQGGTGGLVEDQNVVKLSPGVIFRLRDQMELSLEMIHVASGCNTITGNMLSLGLALKK